MELTEYQAKAYSNVHGQVRGKNVDELKALLSLSEQLDEASDGGGEIDDDLMKKCYGILKRFEPTWKADERLVDMLEKIEAL